jgi:hypothetical protein
MRFPSLLACLFFALASVACSQAGSGRGRPDRGRGEGSDAAVDRDADAGVTRERDAGTSVRPDAGENGEPTRPSGPDRDDDGLPDDEEAALGTDPEREDTDGDGIADGVEVLAGADPTSAASTIPDEDFYVVLPFEGPAQRQELEFTARLGKADVFFLVDTTGSMGATIRNVRSSLSDTIVPALEAAIADVAMGVGDFRDFPGNGGAPGDWPFEMRQRITGDVGAVQAALNGLQAAGGDDIAESALEGLYASVAGTGPCGPDEGFGEACFRTDSHPIVVVVTDAPFHNGTDPAYDYEASVGARTWTETIGVLNDHGVKIVGASVEAFSSPIPLPGRETARPDLEALARETSSRGTSGLTVFDAPRGEVTEGLVGDVAELVGAEEQDVTSRQIDDPSDDIDATRFIQAVTPVRATRATRFDHETFYGVGGGTTITFEVTFRNGFLPAEHFVQIYRAEIEVHNVPAEDRLDVRNVYIVVPAMDGTLI